MINTIKMSKIFASVQWSNYPDDSWKPITEKWNDIYSEFKQKIDALIEEYGGEEKIIIRDNGEEGKPLQDRLFIELR